MPRDLGSSTQLRHNAAQRADQHDTMKQQLDGRSNGQSALTVDWRQAQRFTQLLHGQAETEFRFIHPDGRVKHLWGDLNDVSDPDHPRLRFMEQLNRKGYNVYQVVNRPSEEGRRRVLKLGKGVRDQDIAEISALFVEIDREDPRPGANLEQVRNAAAPPSLIVQSSTLNKIHAYWLVDDMPLDLWKRLQPQMIAKFGGDPACKNLSRVMRVPGFWHVKGEPMQTAFRSVG